MSVEVADLAKELETKAGTWIVTTGGHGSIIELTSGGNSNISYPTWRHLPNIHTYSWIFIVYIYIVVYLLGGVFKYFWNFHPDF